MVVNDITCSGVSHTFRSDGRAVEALKAVDIAVERGSTFCIVGPSGCGKSTLLRIILELEKQSSGAVNIDTGRRDEGIAYIPQAANLLPWRTALQNASLGMELKKATIDSALLENLKAKFRDYGLAGFEHTRWRELSGGMRQKVAIICALASRPSILICDEPFSAIDFVSRLALLNQFKSQCDVLGLTAVIVTHNIEEAIFLGNKIAVFSRRPGHVKALYPVDLGEAGYDSVKCRETPAFQKLFRDIWGDLQKD